MNDKDIEQEIQAKGKTAPRVTPADIEANIASEHYFTADDGVSGAAIDAAGNFETLSVTCLYSLRMLTFCVLVTRNDHTVTGEAHCQNPAKFDAKIGRTEARKDAINKLWPMVVYADRERKLANQ